MPAIQIFTALRDKSNFKADIVNDPAAPCLTLLSEKGKMQTAKPPSARGEPYVSNPCLNHA